MGLPSPLGTVGAGFCPGCGWRAFGAPWPAMDGRLGHEGPAAGRDGADLLAPSPPPDCFPGRNAVGGGAAGRGRGISPHAAASRPLYAGLGRIAGRINHNPAHISVDAGAALSAPLPAHDTLPCRRLLLLRPGRYRQRANRTGQRLSSYPAGPPHGHPGPGGAGGDAAGIGTRAGRAACALPYPARRQPAGGAAADGS